MSLSAPGDLFGDAITGQPADHLPVLPVSVVEIGAQGKRPPTKHDTESSRSAYSGFPGEAVDLAYSLFLRDATTVFDPFAGWGERGAGATKYGKRYIGIDTSSDAIAKAATLGVMNTLADARTFPTPPHDGLLTCPPYWNLERYASTDGLDRAETWEGFLADLAAIWERSLDAMKVGGVAVIVAGDWRRDHRYHDLTFMVEAQMGALGMTPIDKVVLSRLGVTKVKIMLSQAKRLGYTVRCHETMLVYQKR